MNWTIMQYTDKVPSGCDASGSTLALANSCREAGNTAGRSILHGESVDVTGMYVWVSGRSQDYYSDVPEERQERTDTTSVIYIGMDPPDDAIFPYTVNAIIQPHGSDGAPLDEFSIVITDRSHSSLWKHA